MKFKIIALLCLTWAGTSTPKYLPQMPQKIPFVSSLYYPKEVQSPQRLALLYKGDIFKPSLSPSESNSKKAALEIFEDRHCAEFYFLVTESLQIPKDHAITHLSTSAQHPYRLFKLTKKTNYNQKQDEEVPTVSYSWNIEELEHTQPSFRLAENTIIFLMDPTFVELESISGKPDDVFIKLPSIVFKNVPNEEAFNTTCRRMLLSIMDFKFFHKDSSKTSKHIAANCVVSLPSPANYLIS